MKTQNSQKCEVRESDPDLFVRSGFRFLHAQCGWVVPSATVENAATHMRKADPEFVPHWRYPDRDLQRAKAGLYTRSHLPLFENATLCGSLWKPGWGLHSSAAVVEIRFRPGSRIVVFTHDVMSSRSGRAPRGYFGDPAVWGRRTGEVSKHARCVTSPRQLDLAKIGLDRRHIQDRIARAEPGVCYDPVNEVWFLAGGIEAYRLVGILGKPHTLKGHINTHHYKALRIRVLSDWLDATGVCEQPQRPPSSPATTAAITANAFNITFTAESTSSYTWKNTAKTSL